MAEQTRLDSIESLLDNDWYKFLMQYAVLKLYPKVDVEYRFINRSPQMAMNRAGVDWIKSQIQNLATLRFKEDECEFLQRNCADFSPEYFDYLRTFSLDPASQVSVTFTPFSDIADTGPLEIKIKGRWPDTILYEMPILALVSQAYFKFVDRDWTHVGQEEAAYTKGTTLFANGCIVSEFGTRRRRDLHTHDMVIRGLLRASHDAAARSLPGTLVGTSNVFLARRHGITPVGTQAHEWMMGIAAIHNNYESANELALRNWHECFPGYGLKFALPDTFGTPAFLRDFKKSMTPVVPTTSTMTTNTAKATTSATSTADSAPPAVPAVPTFAQKSAGLRQDSGNPEAFVAMVADFYTSLNITSGKAILFSDGLNVGECLKLKRVAEGRGLAPSFGIGTFLTNDFRHASDGSRSKAMNIVIKLSKAGGRGAVKLSDEPGKNTGEKSVVEDVKARLGYAESN